MQDRDPEVNISLCKLSHANGLECCTHTILQLCPRAALCAWKVLASLPGKWAFTFWDKLEVLSSSQSYVTPSSVFPYHCASSLVATVISTVGVDLSLYTQNCGRCYTFYLLCSDLMSGSKSPSRGLVDNFFLSIVVARPLTQGESDRLTLCLERKENGPPPPSLIVSAEVCSLCFRATLKMPGVLARLVPWVPWAPPFQAAMQPLLGSLPPLGISPYTKMTNPVGIPLLWGLQTCFLLVEKNLFSLPCCFSNTLFLLLHQRKRLYILAFTDDRQDFVPNMNLMTAEKRIFPLCSYSN